MLVAAINLILANGTFVPISELGRLMRIRSRVLVGFSHSFDREREREPSLGFPPVLFRDVSTLEQKTKEDPIRAYELKKGFSRLTLIRAVNR